MLTLNRRRRAQVALPPDRHCVSEDVADSVKLSATGFALLGVAFLAYGFTRERLVEQAVARGDYVRPDERVLGSLTAIGVLLGLAVLLIVVIEG
jgi:uncharacterized membrane protein YidH (DUF202 family)